MRETVASYVGYPKDVVSRKLLKADVLFGDDAIKHRLSLDFYRPLEHGVIKSGDDSEKMLRAAKDLIGEIIRRAQPRKDELVYAVIGAPAQASIHNKDAILQAAKETVDSVMLCSEPFSVAYGLDMLDDVLVIDIGAGTTDLCRMHGTMPEDADQITITYAGDWVDNKLRRAPEPTPTRRRSSPSRCSRASRSVTLPWRSRFEPAVVKLPVNGKPTEFDVTPQLREACQGIVSPIVEGLAAADRDLRSGIPGAPEGPRPARRRRQPDQGPRHRHRARDARARLGGGQA